MQNQNSICAPAASAWWQDPATLSRFVIDLIAGELALLRKGVVTIRSLPWDGDIRIDADLGADSLELMLLGTALAETIHLHESGVEDYLLAKRTLNEWTDIARSGLSYFSTTLTFRTSGSAGVPKPCMHSLDSLNQEVDQLAVLFGGRRRILRAVPSHHIYGFLFTVLLPGTLGIGTDAIVDLRTGSPARLSKMLRAGDLVVGHPEFWQAVVRCVPSFPPDVVGVTSTAPCPPAVGTALNAAGLAQFVHLYGSTETAGIGWRTSDQEPYQLFDHWSFEKDQPSQLMRKLPDGTCVLTHCQDALVQHNARTFFVGARLDAAVQVGGINVYPDRISALLREHPAVKDAAVRLMRPEEGSRLKAFVVPHDAGVDTNLLQRELSEWTNARLTAAERPKAYTFGRNLPRAAVGKLCDWATETGAPASNLAEDGDHSYDRSCQAKPS